MLQKTKRPVGKNVGGRFAIVASKYNTAYVDGMLDKAREVFESAGVADLRIIRVPGAFEIPAVATALARRSHPPLSALICLGVILRGETTHAQNIAEAVSDALVRIQVDYELPVIHEVLLLENEQQARVRCLSDDHNRGAEAAQTAIEMAGVMSGLGPKEAKRTKRTSGLKQKALKRSKRAR